MSDHTLDPKFLAAVDMIARTGATAFRIAHSDEEDEGDPVIWHATASYGDRHEVDASLNPVKAVLRLCERLIDGGLCVHCHQPTVFNHEDDYTGDEALAASLHACLYAWDPELSTFRRSCEGET